MIRQKNDVAEVVDPITSVDHPPVGNISRIDARSPLSALGPVVVFYVSTARQPLAHKAELPSKLGLLNSNNLLTLHLRTRPHQLVLGKAADQIPNPIDWKSTPVHFCLSAAALNLQARTASRI